MRFRPFSDFGFSLHPVLIRLAIVASALLVDFISASGDLRRKIRLCLAQQGAVS